MNNIRDSYIENVLHEVVSDEFMNDFMQYTRSFYTTEGHYDNLWLYNWVLTRPHNLYYKIALRITRDRFKLLRKAQAYDWDQLDQVPFISGTGAG